MYVNRALINNAYFFSLIFAQVLNFHDSLSDAKTATDLQPSYVKAIVTGKSQKRKWGELYVVILPNNNNNKRLAEECFVFKVIFSR